MIINSVVLIKIRSLISNLNSTSNFLGAHYTDGCFCHWSKAKLWVINCNAIELEGVGFVEKEDLEKYRLESVQSLIFNFQPNTFQLWNPLQQQTFQSWTFQQQKRPWLKSGIEYIAFFGFGLENSGLKSHTTY